MTAGTMKTTPAYSVASRLRPGSVYDSANKTKMTADQSDSRDMGAA